MSETRDQPNLIAPIAKLAPRAELTPAPRPPEPVAPTNAAPTAPPNRIPTMPPRPSAPEVPRPLDVPRRPSELAASSALDRPPAPHPASSQAAARADSDTRRMIVGRDISLQGEIKACDLLIVEGTIEATLSGCREISIAETGLFHGTATVTEAEIRGRFEGNLVVENRLLVRATGSVSGTVRYGQIEVECGGRIEGDFHLHAASAPAAPALAVEPLGTAAAG